MGKRWYIVSTMTPHRATAFPSITKETEGMTIASPQTPSACRPARTNTMSYSHLEVWQHYTSGGHRPSHILLFCAPSLKIKNMPFSLIWFWIASLAVQNRILKIYLKDKTGFFPSEYRIKKSVHAQQKYFVTSSPVMSIVPGLGDSENLRILHFQPYV